jgi:hypothetical protein
LDARASGDSKGRFYKPKDRSSILSTGTTVSTAWRRTLFLLARFWPGDAKLLDLQLSSFGKAGLSQRDSGNSFSKPQVERSILDRPTVSTTWRRPLFCWRVGGAELPKRPAQEKPAKGGFC